MIGDVWLDSCQDICHIAQLDVVVKWFLRTEVEEAKGRRNVEIGEFLFMWLIIILNSPSEGSLDLRWWTVLRNR